MSGYPTMPAPETKRKKSIIEAALSPYISKPTPEKMEEEYESLRLQARNARAKNILQREKNLYKKMTENQSGSGVPDYLGLNKPVKKQKDPWNIDFD